MIIPYCTITVINRLMTACTYSCMVSFSTLILLVGSFDL